jgi:hypothetical protein
MSTTSQKYTLGKIKQLIDLNGDSINFDLNFKVSSDGATFNVLVVDQNTLDNTPELQYKEVTGSIAGNIVADKNTYQNYFLILKSENPCIVEVEIVKKELPKTPTTVIPRANDIKKSVDLSSSSNTDDDKINWVKIGFIGISIIGAMIVIYFIFIKKNSSVPLIDVTQPKQVDTSAFSFSTAYQPTKKHAFPYPSPSPSPSPYLSKSPSPLISSNSLLDRLKKFST